MAYDFGIAKTKKKKPYIGKTMCARETKEIGNGEAKMKYPEFV